jgi:glycosyltransferase involved in cell wall biosynthesis
VSLLAEFDEGGFFDRVLIAFPLARVSSEVWVSDRVVVRDIGTDWLPFAGRFRWLRRMAAPLHITRTLVLLVRFVRRERVDLVRATDPCVSGLIGWLAARLTGRPLCVSIHADFDKRHDLGGASAGATVFGSRTAATIIERFVLRRAEMVMPIRESLRPYVLRLGARPERIRIIPHGTDLSDFIAPPPLDVSSLFDISPASRIVSFVGRLVRENYVDDFLEVARRLAAVRRDFTVLVLGGGPEASRLTAAVDSDPVLRDVVRLVGFQPRSVVAAVRRRSAASLCLMGGFSLIEACAAASPVIAYDVEWHSELIRDGETGFLVAEHDLDRLTSVVNRLLDDPDLGAALGTRARDLAVSRHGLAPTTAVKRNCYLEVLAGASNG